MLDWFTNLDGFMLSALGETLLHFLWQGAVIFFLYRLVGQWLQSPVYRYWLATATMLTYLLAPILTFMLLTSEPELREYQISAVSGAQVSTILGSSSNSELTLSEVFNITLPWLSILWMSGVLMFSLKLIVELLRVNQLAKQQTAPVSQELEANLYRLISGMGIHVPVRLLKSHLAAVPMVIGWLRPVVLLPAATILQLNQQQLQMLIAHELAHIKRYDYLVNLIQSFLEVIFFYHPVVKWTSNDMRVEREHCCDDIVAEYFNDPLGYARALTEAEASRNVSPSLVVVASNGGDLKHRVKRIAGLVHHQSESNSKIIAAFSAMLMGSMIFAAAQVQATHQELKIADWPVTQNSETIAEPLPVLATEENLSETPEQAATPVISFRPAANPIAIVGKPLALSQNEAPIDHSDIQEDLNITTADLKVKEGIQLASLAPVALPLDNKETVIPKISYEPAEPQKKPAAIINAPLPEYPSYARRKQIEAEIDVVYEITESGWVRIVSMNHPQLSYFKSSITETMADWRFTPAEISGQKVSSYAEKRFSFKINGELNTSPIITGSRIRQSNSGDALIERNLNIASEEQNPDTSPPVENNESSKPVSNVLTQQRAECTERVVTGSRVGRKSCRMQEPMVRTIRLAKQ